MTTFEELQEAIRSQIDFLRYALRDVPIGAQRDRIKKDIGTLKMRLKKTPEEWAERGKKKEQKHGREDA